MIKLISFIALTHFFLFNQLKLLRQPGYLLFFKSNQLYVFTVSDVILQNANKTRVMETVRFRQSRYCDVEDCISASSSMYYIK